MEEENKESNINVFGDVCMRKVRRKRQKALVQEMLYDYATNTGLHGLPYTTKRGFTTIEKIFWIVTFISSICFCAYLINNIWIKWKTSPVLVTISETLIPVEEVPFPSVTICPQLKIKKSVFDYAAEDSRLDIILNNLTEMPSFEILNAFVKMDSLSLVCNDRRTMQELVGSDSKHELVSMIRNQSYKHIRRNIIDVAPKREDIFAYCKWRGKTDYSCIETVTEVLTSEGLCYSINSLAAHDILREKNSGIYFNANTEARNWSMEEGYKSFGKHVYPAAGKAFGASPDLEIIFQDMLSEHGKKCDEVNQGFNKVYIHHPADLPQSSLYYFAVRNEEVSSMALSFGKINTAASVKKYPKEIRQCYFPGEFNLKYFKIYTASNCMIECLSNITYDKCGCVGFYMPHKRNTTICTFTDNLCLDEAREELINRGASKNDQACLCLPSCYAVDYQAEILKTAFKFDHMLSHYGFSGEENITYSKLEMFYKGPRFVSMHRSELFGTTDFLANIGGLLGLFLGFSFLSLIELIYYLTLRLCCILKKDLKEEKFQRRNKVRIAE